MNPGTKFVFAQFNTLNPSNYTLGAPVSWTFQPQPNYFSTPLIRQGQNLNSEVYTLPYQTFTPIVQNPPGINYIPLAPEPAYIIAKIPVVPVAQPIMKAKPKPPLNSALERRRRSIDYKKKQFHLKRLQVRERKKTIQERRLRQLTQKIIKRDRESLLPIYARKRQRRYAECPLATCPKKLLGKKVRRRTLNRDSDDSFFSSVASLITHMSHNSKRSRSPFFTPGRQRKAQIGK